MILITDKEEYLPGETVNATIRISLGKPVKARGIFAVLYCDEMTKVSVERVMTDFERQQRRELGMFADTHLKKDTDYRHKIVHKQEKKIAGEGEFSSGEYEVSFALAQNAHPTDLEYGHNNKIVQWKLKAKLDIPLAPDLNAEKEIIVVQKGGD